MIPIAKRKHPAMAIIWNVAALSFQSWDSPIEELALSNKLKTLESSWSSLDWWLNFWTATVVVGVVVELVVIAVEYRHDRSDFEGGVIHPPDKPSTMLLFWGLLGAGLVALGVAGEFRVHVKAGRVETDMRNASGRLVALISDRASANEVEAAQLRKEAEIERIKRLRLVAALAPRSLSTKDVAEICEAVRPFAKPSIRVLVISLQGNPIRLAIQIAAALRCAGFSVDIEQSLAVTPEVSIGSPLEYLAPGNAANAIVGALAGKVYLWGFTRVLPSGSPITIFVGERFIPKLPS
jgi:hypothetical protein